MKRKIVKIDENKCNGCGLCIPNCAEGALQIIDGKARLISDLFCDGLGACLGHCPEGAIEIEEREAAAYDEYAVMKDMIVPAGKNTIIAHVRHLQEHGEHEYLKIAFDYLRENSMLDVIGEIADQDRAEESALPRVSCGGGCPGSASKSFSRDNLSEDELSSSDASTFLNQWPVQLHLISPSASFLKKADLLLAADCAAYAFGNFHKEFLRGKVLAIACPKLDSDLELYVNKIALMIDGAELNTITVLRMEVPCCGGLMRIVQAALAKASREVPVKQIVMRTDGTIGSETWV
ncbi:MAG: 4Fe-4S binding protein [Spirochaetales bacterium]|nr:4Fe-4S binding protein [Spirochaetales bacterium]